uniref:Uncharacterized protein n=1 Tax=Spiroplasma kunkelii CR2-3x TaxID=273035 RepID=Q5VCC5_SPIKU|nr:hypothetical protein SKUN_p0060 [Spiroplasma kunkelii CR2-3x]
MFYLVVVIIILVVRHIRLKSIFMNFPTKIFW